MTVGRINATLAERRYRKFPLALKPYRLQSPFLEASYELICNLSS
jgi:hypothetical protein